MCHISRLCWVQMMERMPEFYDKPEGSSLDGKHAFRGSRRSCTERLGLTAHSRHQPWSTGRSQDWAREWERRVSPPSQNPSLHPPPQDPTLNLLQDPPVRPMVIQERAEQSPGPLYPRQEHADPYPITLRIIDPNMPARLSPAPLHSPHDPLYPAQEPLHPLQEPLHPPQKPLYPAQEPLHPLQEPLHPLQQPRPPLQDKAVPLASHVLTSPYARRELLFGSVRQDLAAGCALGDTLKMLTEAEHALLGDAGMCTVSGVRVTLHDQRLWKAFYVRGTEMVINKCGR